MSSSQSLLQQNKPIQQFYIKKTHSNRIYRLSQAKYLRKDIPTYLDELMAFDVGTVNVAPQQQMHEQKKDSTREVHILIPSYALMRHQIDFLENTNVRNILFIQTLYQQIRKENRSLYSRLKKLVYVEGKNRHLFLFENEFCHYTHINDLDQNRNLSLPERQFRKVCSVLKYYKKKIEELKTPDVDVKMVYLTDVSEQEASEATELKELLGETVETMSVVDYVQKHTGGNLPVSLLDQLSMASQEEVPDDDADQQEIPSGLIFRPHISLKEIKEGIEKKKVFHGTLRVRRTNINQGSVEVSSNVGTESQPCKEIFISSFKHMNRAVDGDVVALRLLPRSQWKSPSSRVQRDVDFSSDKSAKDGSNPNARPTGEVVGIIKRNWRAYCGSIDEDAAIGPGSRSVFFIPVLQNVPKIKIRTRQSEELITKRIQVAIDSWPPNSYFPHGHYVSTLGEIGDLNTESKVVLIEHDIPHYTFPQEVLDCLPAEDWHITPEELSKRKDLRDYPVASVDPPGCTDIDDALHAYKLDNGNYHIGVHIADVTHFVQEGTPLDLEAAKRSTSVYLVEKRIDMLPKVLTEDLCSLRSGVPRLAFSCMWEITPDAKIVKTDFCKSVIHSKASLTYQEAQIIIEDSNNNSKTANSLRILRNISKILRKRRFEKGALALASPQVKFNLDTETLNPTDVSMYEMRDTNSMVEEFMLLANISVAKQIEQTYSSSAILRLHPSPDTSRFDSLTKSLKTWGLSLDVTNSKSLSSSLDKVKLEGNEYVNTLTRILTTRCMQQAKYFPSGDRSYDEYWHYGLAIPIYTHFTSPIRRYADVLVHRLLGCSIGVYPITQNIAESARLREICTNMNYRTRQADYAGRSSVSLYTLFYFANKTVQETAYVLSLRPNAISYFIPRYGFEHMTYIDEDKWDLNAETETITEKSTGRQLRIFGKLRVRLSVQTTKHHRRKLVGEILAVGDDSMIDDSEVVEEVKKSNPKKRKR